MRISMLVAVIKTEHNMNVKGSWESSSVPPTLTCQRAAYHKALIKNESFHKWFIHKCIEKKSLTNIWRMRHQTYLFLYLSFSERCLPGKCVITSLSSFPLRIHTHRKYLSHILLQLYILFYTSYILLKSFYFLCF